MNKLPQIFQVDSVPGLLRKNTNKSICEYSVVKFPTLLSKM